MNTANRRRFTLLAMSIAQGMIMVDITIVNTALPAIQRSLQMSAGSLEWVISAYALSLAALIPLGGALGDRYGRKRLFLLGLLCFGVGSVACALSASDAALIASRAAQGVGGAVMSALTLAILTDAYPADERPGAIGVWAAIGGLGFGLGPVAGGLLLSVLSWPAVFWVNVPITAVGVVVAAVYVEDSRSREHRPLDLVGALTCAIGLLLLTFGLIESSSYPWVSPQVAGSLGLGMALLVAFGLWEEHTPWPMLPMRLLKARSLATGCGVYLLAYLAWAGVMFYVTLLYQNVDGWSALRTGVSWLAMNVPFLVVAQFAGRLQERISSRWVMTVGCLTGAAGVAGLASVAPSSPFVLTGVWYVLAGVGYGMLAPAVASAAMRDVPSAVAGAASGLLSATRQVGTSVGLAVIGAIGAAAATADWTSEVGAVPPALRPAADGLAQHVAAAQLGLITATLGDAYWQPAADAFLHGYRVALAVAGGCILVAAVVAVVGLAGAPRHALRATNKTHGVRVSRGRSQLSARRS
ncbi:MAG: MFS transporter [Chloroflexi bacterium]|nr:MFS transporter [Chloroflexota bacterium]